MYEFPRKKEKDEQNQLKKPLVSDRNKFKAAFPCNDVQVLFIPYCSYRRYCCDDSRRNQQYKNADNQRAGVNKRQIYEIYFNGHNRNVVRFL